MEGLTSQMPLRVRGVIIVILFVLALGGGIVFLASLLSKL